MRAIDEERRRLLSFTRDQAEVAASAFSAPVPQAASKSGYAPEVTNSVPVGNCGAHTVPVYRHAPEAGAATQSSHAALHAEAHLSLQHNLSDSAALPGSLQDRLSLSVPVQHASSAQFSTLQAESSQTPSSSKRLCAPGAEIKDHDAAGAAAQTEPSTETHSRSHVDDLCKVENVSSGPHTLHHHASMPVASSNGWHLRASSPAGMVTRRKNNMYVEQQVYWQKKEALVPTIKDCIQEVQQLRAQLSADSQELFCFEEQAN